MKAFESENMKTTAGYAFAIVKELPRFVGLILFPILILGLGLANAKIEEPSQGVKKSVSRATEPRKTNSKKNLNSSKSQKSIGKKVQPKNLRRELVFDGSTVSGQYHSAGEAVAKVEQEKKMNNLIGLRHDFKDRLTAEKERLKRGEAVVVD